ncbi:SgcJ/EcaC family oxidoreductase [Rhodopirellula sp. JC740]|uniref:SgcJ/EcaC family oxidoreductase n=1 Tax=Rhodopirellula halodulae TaxID=2894198 RepID=A0ABS8NE91_9BACT|nr:SgcJ/EcaC family oxidoreductase [Rhodopirellula sp. JC740]MCC9641871.1 SgcJ/EcaC family oxidoreductase [Rhodopirellula sp. JC740]
MRVEQVKSLAIALLSVTWCALLCVPSVSADQETDEAKLREDIDAYVQAFNQGDAKALAAMWSPEAVYTNPLSGEQVVGRDAIEKQFAAIFSENQDTKLAATTERIQFISPGVALENGTAIVSRPGEAPEETAYQAVYVKQDGAWLLDRVSEEVVAIPRANHLAKLEWLIGVWIDEDDNARIESNYRWTKNRAFITQLFSITVGDRVEHSGMQIIGWDAASESIRSWVFDSDGGFGEGVWSQHDNAWHIRTKGTLTDGSKTSSTHVMTSINDNLFTWQSIDRMVDGELQPNVDEVVVAKQVGTNP